MTICVMIWHFGEVSFSFFVLAVAFSTEMRSDRSCQFYAQAIWKLPLSWGSSWEVLCCTVCLGPHQVNSTCQRLTTELSLRLKVPQLHCRSCQLECGHPWCQLSKNCLLFTETWSKMTSQFLWSLRKMIMIISKSFFYLWWSHSVVPVQLCQHLSVALRTCLVFSCKRHHFYPLLNEVQPRRSWSTQQRNSDKMWKGCVEDFTCTNIQQ